MLPMLIAGCLFLVCLLLFMRLFAVADPKMVTFAVKAAGVGMVVVLIGFLVFTGRISWILGLFPFLLPFLLRKVSLGTAGPFGGLSEGRQRHTSNVRTPFVEMRLDHETDELDGDILQGPHAGRQLSAISTDDLLQLIQWLRVNDRKSALLLEAYLDRRCPDWRTRLHEADAHQDGGGENGRTEPAGAMSASEAYRVLGLEPGAPEPEIRAAYHRLISGVHPDKGGSSFLAAQVNRAKDILLGERSGR
jgi:DnaJ-like protein